MSKRATRVAAGEMAILNMLWIEGPLALGDAHRKFSDYGAVVSYPTMQTRLNRLTEKRLVARSDERPARYRALVTRDQVTLGHLRELVTKLGHGNVVPLVAHLLSEQALTDKQVAELEHLLARARKSSSSTKKRRPQS
jgi:BlaI family transcriptional regulator, penicillinase repressor